MIDREKVLAVLAKRFPDARQENVAAAANAIVGLDEEWEEVTDRDDLAQQVERDDALRVFRRRGAWRP